MRRLRLQIITLKGDLVESTAAEISPTHTHTQFTAWAYSVARQVSSATSPALVRETPLPPERFIRYPPLKHESTTCRFKTLKKLAASLTPLSSSGRRGSRRFPSRVTSSLITHLSRERHRHVCGKLPRMPGWLYQVNLRGIRSVGTFRLFKNCSPSHSEQLHHFCELISTY